MTEQLCNGLIAKIPEVSLEGEVEIDEVYFAARTQGPAGRDSQKGRPGQYRKLARAPACGTLEKDKPPFLGLTRCGGQVVMRMRAYVQQKIIQLVIAAIIARGR